LNYVREYWGVGRAATYDDFPLLGRGPFGEAIQFRQETDPTFRPLLMVPRTRLHNTGLDAKGPGRSVSLVVWLTREGGNHAIAGIWHEGTDLRHVSEPARRVEPGMRQYALFAGLAGNPGAPAGHVSDNGGPSFGDIYARHLAVGPKVIPVTPPGATGEALDRGWNTAGFTYDNARKVVTAYLNGEAGAFWIDNPQRHRVYQWPAKAWLQAQLRKMPGLQEGEDPNFPADQLYDPPEAAILKRTKLSEDAVQRVELHEYEFTKVRVTYFKRGGGERRELASLRANPFWSGKDLYIPPSPASGGPFSIGRVIHSGRNPCCAGYIGGVAVFSVALTDKEMQTLARVAMRRSAGKWTASPIRAAAPR
jgi:hypothetical protein